MTFFTFVSVLTLLKKGVDFTLYWDASEFNLGSDMMYKGRKFIVHLG